MSTKFTDTAIKLLGWGSLTFGVWGLVHPRSLTELMGDYPEVGRPLGVRDTAIGIALLGWPGRWPLAMRVASDLHDAVRLRERSPKVALGAAAFCLGGLAVLVSHRRDR